MIHSQEMSIPGYQIGDNHLSIDKFREMDYLAVERYHLPVELMMENAGLQLARLVAHFLPSGGKVLIGIGPGNNGGGGLVAARRLSGWGFQTHLDIPLKDINDLTKIQLDRALATGVSNRPVNDPGIFVDAYLGFSQRLPLPDAIRQSVDMSKTLICPRISLDIPTGFDKSTGKTDFNPGVILTLAAMKTELLSLSGESEMYLADLGIPEVIYGHYGIKQPSQFRYGGLLKCIL
ncbi:MAG: NAD(P)H-hydrate epimerase [Bacteroidales bacterium]|nr:NAD(P)H-hydrate epimerase [Bacteroidales bacterium]